MKYLYKDCISIRHGEYVNFNIKLTADVYIFHTSTNILMQFSPLCGIKNQDIHHMFTPVASGGPYVFRVNLVTELLS